MDEPSPPVSATALSRRILTAIDAEGPITFAAFMEAALYDPDEGFYARPPVGTAGHFVTSPHVSPVFGRLLARQVAQAFDLLGSPDPFHLVEFGAGDGTLAGQIREAVQDAPALAAAYRYLGVERSSGARRALAEAGFETVDDDPSGTALPHVLTGVVLANELLDNLPFHLLRRRDGSLEELFVTSEAGRLALVPGAASDPELLGPAAALEDGATGVVSLEARRWLQRAAGILGRGWILAIDYGGDGPRPVQGYRSHRSVEDVLAAPGTTDITAGVDLDALAAGGTALGLRVWGPVSQREALLALGFGTWAEAERRRTADERASGQELAAARRWARRSRESLLVDTTALGGLQVMAFGVGVDEPLVSVGGSASG